MATLDQAIIKAFAQRASPSKSNVPPRARDEAGEGNASVSTVLETKPIDVVPGALASLDMAPISISPPDASTILALASCVGVVLAGASIPPLPAPPSGVRHARPVASPKESAALDRRTPLAAVKGEMPEPGARDTVSWTDTQPLPLSLYAHAITPPGKLRPLLEVDHFRWPDICERILRGASVGFAQQCANLLDRARQGTRVVAVTGEHAREGRTTMLLCLAKRLAENGCRVAVVDADLRQPALARLLGVAANRGWEHVIQDEQPLEEVLIESVRDGIVLLPLAHPRPEDDTLLRNPRSGLCLATLRAQHDVVLVDAGPIVGRGLTGFVGLSEQAALDGALVLRDSRSTAKEGLADMKRLLTAARVPIVGLVDNFTSPARGD